jgi:uncharacterized phiE125 gp8 family phage protein
MALSLLIPPAVEPVTLQEAKDHLRLDTDAHDPLVQMQIQAAREHVEMFTRRQLVVATYLLTLPAFAAVIPLPLPPLHAVMQVQYRDPQGVLTVLDPSAYTVDTSSEPGRLYVTTIPPTATALDAVQITFEAGYGPTGSDVPGRLRAAILLLMADLYEHAEAQAEVRLQDNTTAWRLLWGARAEVLS